MSDSNDPAPDQRHPTRPVGKPLLARTPPETPQGNVGDTPRSTMHALGIPEPPPGVGLLVLSTRYTVLHTNDEASALLERLRELQTPHLGDTPRGHELPTTVQLVCDEVERTLVERSEHNDWWPFELSRTVGDAREAIMVRAFVFPSRASLSRTRILITLHTL